MRLFSLSVSFSLFCLIGCSHVTIQHVGANDKSGGVHFYEPRPYLLISKDTVKTGPGPNDVREQYTSQIIWLPDPTQKYVVRTVQLLGSVEESITLKDGWMLTQFGAKSDPKIPETINALAGVAKLAQAGASKSPEGLYRIDINKKGNVSLVPQPGWNEPKPVTH